MAPFVLNLGKKIHGKEATHNGNRVRHFNCEFLVKLSSQVFYRDSQTIPYIFVGFPSH